MQYRSESDSVGTLNVPADAYYGVQSLRAQQNFRISGQPMHPVFIDSLILIKRAAAQTNMQAGMLSTETCSAICAACDRLLNGEMRDQFIADAIQGGAGTSANMNANEVIANLANQMLGGALGAYDRVHPNDHVNMSQSTNDVVPTAGKLTVLTLLPQLIAKLGELHDALMAKAAAFDGILKMGRTQLQDAVPMRLGQSFKAFASAVRRDIQRLVAVGEEMRTLNLGGTAIGSAINVPAYYLRHIVPNLSSLTGQSLRQAEDLFDATQNLDCFVAVSGALKACAVNLSKMSNDLRLMSSGPRTGIHEINLPARQNGSSIMPGKVNPVIPEVVTQVAFRVAGNDITISMAAEAGQLELNAFEPVLFYALFESIQMMTGAVDTLTHNCVEGITANEEECLQYLESSVGIVTALCPYIGYIKAAEIAKRALATGEPVRLLVEQSGLLSAEQLAELLDPAAMTEPSTDTIA